MFNTQTLHFLIMATLELSQTDKVSLDSLSFDYVIEAASAHQRLSVKAWIVVMRSHYQSAEHDKACKAMDQNMLILHRIKKHAYSNWPHFVYDQLIETIDSVAV